MEQPLNITFILNGRPIDHVNLVSDHDLSKEETEEIKVYLSSKHDTKPEKTTIGGQLMNFAFKYDELSDTLTISMSTEPCCQQP